MKFRSYSLIEKLSSKNDQMKNIYRNMQSRFSYLRE